MIFRKAGMKGKRSTGLWSRFSIFMASLLSLSLSALTPIGFGGIETPKEEPIQSIQEGDDSLSKFIFSLKDSHGFGGKLSFDASF